MQEGQNSTVLKKILLGVFSIVFFGAGLYYGYKGIHHLRAGRSYEPIKPLSAAGDRFLLKVSGMQDQDSATQIEKTLLKIHGVQAVDVDYKSGETWIYVEEGFSKKSTLVQSIQDAGFSVSEDAE